MIDIKDIALNLVKEAVNSTLPNYIKEGRPATPKNLTFDGSVGSNADQLFLRYGRTLNKKEKELEILGDQIATISKNMDDEAIEQAVQDSNSELYKLVKKYNEIEAYADSLESIMVKYAQEYKDNNGIVSNETRAELRNFDQDEKNRYNTDLYQKALDKLKTSLDKKGITRNSFDNMGLDPNDPKANRLSQMSQDLGWIEK